MTKQFENDKRFKDAVRGYETYESMGKMKWFDAKTRELADEVFDDTVSIMNEIASDNSVSFEDVLEAVRSVSRF